ncbi:hypothetical protein IFT48_02935 [Pseudomonas fluorescens]|uniref:hypothetical protein n=1 Tax=Pseudomonas TaxID=286 RepID=UPI000F03DC3D|nr:MULTISPECIES: hypothetical protein [Pseudomonas]MBD8088922.1 hypothetical protein [Pseudomonas fluorescens]MBD8615643.1 hypothetical protein [Pseudomonas putida]MBD8681701.1 hypothetical protein [Pseudomonas sp. CFBP 13719]
MTNHIDLRSLEQLRVDISWLDTARTDPLIMVDMFNEFVGDMMKTDLQGYYRLGVSHTSSYKKLWGEPTFVFNGKYPWQTWIFKLTEDENLVLFSDPEGGTSFEYDGYGAPTPEAFLKGSAIIDTIKDMVHKTKVPETGLEP